MVHKKNFHLNNPQNNKNKTGGKVKFVAKNKPSHSTKFKNSSYTMGKGLCHVCVIQITRLRDVPTAMMSANLISAEVRQ